MNTANCFFKGHFHKFLIGSGLVQGSDLVRLHITKTCIEIPHFRSDEKFSKVTKILGKQKHLSGLASQDKKISLAWLHSTRKINDLA
jgi:hypothetical protein